MNSYRRIDPMNLHKLFSNYTKNTKRKCCNKPENFPKMKWKWQKIGQKKCKREKRKERAQKKCCYSNINMQLELKLLWWFLLTFKIHLNMTVCRVCVCVCTAKCWIIKYICHLKVEKRSWKWEEEKRNETHMENKPLWVDFSLSFLVLLLLFWIHCCRFAIIESLLFELGVFVLYLPLTQKSIRTYKNTLHGVHTIWSTLRMQLYILFFLSHCFDFFSSSVCLFALSLSHLSFIYFHPISILCGFSLCWQHKTSLFLWCFSCLWIANNTRKRIERQKKKTLWRKTGTWRTKLFTFFVFQMDFL